jgi:hypothetical protein
MVDIIKAKLQQHPRLVSEITKQGGSAWILSSTHQPTKQNSVWETGGKNWFIKALNDAYLSTTQPVSQPTVKPTKAPVSPAPADSIENDMKVYAYLLNERDGVQPQYFKAGPNENRVYNLNKFGNYDLIDAVTGEIYMRNINMETGKQETEPFLDSPVSQEVIQRELNRIITLRAETNIEEQLAGLGYDINDIINNLANAKTQEDLNKITKILDKLC